MGKIGCICGAVINLTPSPNHVSYDVVSDTKIDVVFEELEKAHESSRSRDDFGTQVAWIFSGRRLFLSLYECPECGRLAVLTDKNIGMLQWYKPEPVECLPPHVRLSELPLDKH
jgi:hypothetical protein